MASTFQLRRWAMTRSTDARQELMLRLNSRSEIDNLRPLIRLKLVSTPVPM